MIESESLKLGGVVTFFRTSQYTVRADLLDALTAVGMATFCPDARNPTAALKDALEACFPHHRVERLRNRNAYEVVDIDRGEDRNDYRHHLWVGVDGDRQIEVKPFTYSVADKVVEAFNKHLGLVTASAVTDCLANALRSLHGTHLPGRGNVYWLPEAKLAEWRLVAGAVEGCRFQGGGNHVHVIRHAMGADEVRAVKDAITQEVAGESARLHTEIMSGDLGEKALLSRQVQVDTLRNKIALYEELLNTGLAGLRDGLDKAEEAAVTASLLISSGARETVTA